MDLKQLLQPMEYKLRTWPWWKQLAYIDARQAQDKLDEVCWPENWKVEYKEIKWELFAWVSIKVWDEWITKWDWWIESNIEKEKWLISDSFKRACVTWGIWRFLYSIKPTKEVWQVKSIDTEVKPKKFFNYQDLVNTVEAGNTTEQSIAKIILEDWFTVWAGWKIAIRHYLNTGEIDKNLFFNK